MKFLSPARLRDSSASQIAEAAVILPMLFMLILSIYWFGRAFSIYSTINHAAREGVRAAGLPLCANCAAQPQNAWPGSDLPGDQVIAASLTQVLVAANLDLNQAQPLMPSPVPPACPGVSPEGLCAVSQTGQFAICRNVILNQSGNSPPVCGAIISFQYPYQFALPFTSLGNQNILLKAQAQLGEEN